MKTALVSISIFGDIMNSAASDISYLSLYKPYIIAIIIIILVIGVFTAVLVKMRI